QGFFPQAIKFGLVLLWFNRKFKNSILLFCASSVFIWTLLTAVYLQFLQYNLWLIYIIGIPVQAIFILWLAFRKFK
ncbi:MAG: hypothetical protein ACI4QV_01345, partial [Acutalibacteraceae bacterium]